MILVINCGSSSLKYEVFQMPDCRSLGKGLVERIGEKTARVSQQSCCKKIERECEIPDHKRAMEIIREVLTDSQDGIINDIRDIGGIGHRVVHGGETYASSVLIDEKVMKAIEDNIELAPLHNPPNLIGIREAEGLLPDVKQVAVFDTAFHQTLPPQAYLYALPREMYEKYRIRRYGFHGTSHRYVAAQAAKYLKRSLDNTNMITCHLGNGCSITAIENGRSIDTSMGFTPLQGLMMGTRSGDIDPAIIFYLLERGFTVDEMNKILNKKSGLLGLSGISNDLRDVEQAAEQGNRQAIEALDVYAYSIRKYIGAYTANLVKVDALVFTGGVGQYGIRMRERICHRLENIGIFMDYRKNLENGSQEGIISMPYSPTVIMVEPTNEELQIAIDTDHIIFNSSIE
ncbi:MAG: acetate kinase [Candidatus Delongbacteria bacterium]|nr:acetate kinase [Candidatus Delongbacteria bacterium]